MLQYVGSRLVSSFLLLLAATLFLSFGVTLVGRTLQILELQREQTRLEQELSAREQRRQELLQLKEAASSEVYVEHVAREQLGLVKPGEIGVVVLTPPRAQPDEPSPPVVRADLRTNWERWRDWLLRR